MHSLPGRSFMALDVGAACPSLPPTRLAPRGLVTVATVCLVRSVPFLESYRTRPLQTGLFPSVMCI